MIFTCCCYVVNINEDLEQNNREKNITWFSQKLSIAKKNIDNDELKKEDKGTDY